MHKPLAEMQHPVLLNLLGWWEKTRGPDELPRRADLDPAELPDILPHVFLVEVVDGRPRRYRFRLCGTQIDAEFGISLTGRDLMELPIAEPVKKSIRQQYQHTVRTRLPTYCEQRFRVAERRQIHYLRLVVPLAADNTRIGYLFGAMVFLESYALRVATSLAG